jgi:hypothetical protein
MAIGSDDRDWWGAVHEAMIVICMGNPWVIFTIHRPVPINNPYPWRVTHGYPINWRILSYFILNVYTKNKNTEGMGDCLSRSPPHHSVLISDSNVDNIVTLYHLRHASRRLADGT